MHAKHNTAQQHTCAVIWITILYISWFWLNLYTWMWNPSIYIYYRVFYSSVAEIHGFNGFSYAFWTVPNMRVCVCEKVKNNDPNMQYKSIYAWYSSTRAILLPYMVLHWLYLLCFFLSRVWEYHWQPSTNLFQKVIYNIGKPAQRQTHKKPKLRTTVITIHFRWSGEFG